MSDVENRLSEMKLTLPPPFVYPNPSRTGCIQVGQFLYTSGHHPPANFGVAVKGKVVADVSLEEARKAAKASALNILASVKQKIGNLDHIHRVIKLLGMVNSSPGFDSQPEVIDGASDLFYELFGPERGQHARSAIGLAELPRSTPLEIEAIFEIRT